MTDGKKPRVLVLSSISGGLAHYTAHFHKPLSKYYKLYVITYRKNYLTGEPINAPGDKVAEKFIKNPEYLIEHDRPQSLFEILDFIEKKNIDLVNIQFGTTAIPVFFYYHILMLKLRQRKIPVVLTCHDVMPRKNLKHNLEILKLVYSEADHFIVGNEKESENLTKNFNIPKSRVSIIEHGVYNKFDLGKYTEKSARKHFGFGKRPVILFFGYIRRYKGIIPLLDAMDEVKKKKQDAILHIAGSTEWEDVYSQIKEKIKKKKLRVNVLSENKYLPIEDIEAAFKSCDIVALPYLQVSQSGVLAMALDFKKPVIVTDLFSESKIIDKKMGYSVKPGDVNALSEAIVKLIEDKELSKKFGEAGYLWVTKNRSWMEIADKLNDIFKKYIK